MRWCKWDDVDDEVWMVVDGHLRSNNSINLRFFSLLFWGFGFEWESEIPQHNNSWSSRIWWGIENLILPHTHRMSMCHLADGTQVIDLKIQKNEIQIPSNVSRARLREQLQGFITISSVICSVGQNWVAKRKTNKFVKELRRKCSEKSVIHQWTTTDTVRFRLIYLCSVHRAT